MSTRRRVTGRAFRGHHRAARGTTSSGSSSSSASHRMSQMGRIREDASVVSEADADRFSALRPDSSGHSSGHYAYSAPRPYEPQPPVHPPSFGALSHEESKTTVDGFADTSARGMPPPIPPTHHHLDRSSHPLSSNAGLTPNALLQWEREQAALASSHSSHPSTIPSSIPSSRRTMQVPAPISTPSVDFDSRTTSGYSIWDAMGDELGRPLSPVSFYEARSQLVNEEKIFTTEKEAKEMKKLKGKDGESLSNKLPEAVFGKGGFSTLVTSMDLNRNTIHNGVVSACSVKNSVVKANTLYLNVYKASRFPFSIRGSMITVDEDADFGSLTSLPIMTCDRMGIGAQFVVHNASGNEIGLAVDSKSDPVRSIGPRESWLYFRVGTNKIVGLPLA